MITERNYELIGNDHAGAFSSYAIDFQVKALGFIKPKVSFGFDARVVSQAEELPDGRGSYLSVRSKFHFARYR